MARHVIVLLNAAAGAGPKAERVREALGAAGLEADVREVPAPRLAEAAREAAQERPDAVVAAGGDGTVSAVAGALAGLGVPLGVLPLGTLNHFAKDAGLPLDLDEAARVLAEGVPRAVDVAEVNGVVFVNNSSIGLYPEVVLDRDAAQRRSSKPKRLATLIAAWRTLRRFPRIFVRVDLLDRMLSRRTPFVFVGNNVYEARLRSPGRRARLDAGVLSVLTAHASTPFAFVRMALAAILRPGARPKAKGLDLAVRPEVVVDAHQREIRVALDGEVRRLAPPLRFRARPGELTILAPPGGPA